MGRAGMRLALINNKLRKSKRDLMYSPTRTKSESLEVDHISNLHQ